MSDLERARRPAGRPGRRHGGLHAAAVQRGARPRTPTCSSTTWWSPSAPSPGASRWHGRGRHRGPRPARGRDLRLGRLPDRGGRAARAGAGDRRDHHDPRRPRGLRAAAARRLRLPGHRRGAGPGAVLRPDGAQGRGRARPRRRPDLPEPGVPRRHPRRPRVDQRDLRRRHEDELRPVPAVLDLHRGRARPPRAQREGAGVQRQGRGPAVPRPREPQAGRRPARGLRHARARRGAVRLGRLLRPADAGRPDRPPARHRAHQRGHRVLVDPRGVLLRRAAALRLRRRRGRAQPVHDGDPPGRRAAEARGRRHRHGRRGHPGRAGAAHLRRPDRVRLGPAHRRRRAPRLGGPGHRHGHRQRVPAPAAAAASSRCARSCAATCP